MSIERPGTPWDDHHDWCVGNDTVTDIYWYRRLAYAMARRNPSQSFSCTQLAAVKIRILFFHHEGFPYSDPVICEIFTDFTGYYFHLSVEPFQKTTKMLQLSIHLYHNNFLFHFSGNG